jgi:membrane protein YdbS with pleckstrin-like domain
MNVSVCTLSRAETIDIDDVTVRQGPIERLLGIGTIAIASTDRTEPLLYMRGIDHVTAVADLIDSTRRAERQRRGLHLEST